MRALLLSDVHTEFAPMSVPAAASDAADVVVLAGDIGKGIGGVKWAAMMFPNTPVLYVPGNHEYYGGALPRTTEKMREAAKGTTVTILERDRVELFGVRFLGTTLWTDFALFGDRNAPLSMEFAREGMNDYRRIRRSPRFCRLRPEDTRRLSILSRGWLQDELAKPFDGPTVVVTHHAPSLLSIQPRYQADRLAPAYASVLDELVRQSGAAMWMHGHTHQCVRYTLGQTAVVANQRGYPGELASGFDPTALVDIPS